VVAFYFCGNDFYKWPDVSQVYLMIFSNLSWMFLVMVASPYRIDKGWTISKVTRSQLAFIFIHLVVVASLITFLNQKYSVVQIALTYTLFTLIFFIWKIFVFYLINLLTAEVPYKNYILIGKNSIAYSVRRYYLINRELKYRFYGYFDHVSKLVQLNSIKKYCVENEIHEILYCSADLNGDRLHRLVGFGLDSLIKIRIITNPISSSQAIALDPQERLPGIDIEIVPLDSSWNRLVKRMFDLLFSCTFIFFIASWLFPIIILLIKIDSTGPVFFLQPRSGQDNRPFNCIKFRTMKVNQDADSRQATKGDSRITKLGSLLRKTSLDELPQFFNVLLGDMSVVGPRPHMLKHTEIYSQLLENFIGRHYVKPGITGLAQVMGYRGETKHLFEMKNRVTLDRFYIENWSFALDLRIIYLTVISLIRGSEKAY
jgi:undecaprenyl-phosphate galactose phosphotransferase/putative colanic acid biosynthesis UDP-glucose lipid carrier transferase